jgi:hypothetical protein
MKMGHDGERLCVAMTYYDFASKSDADLHEELGNVKHILADEVQNFQEYPFNTYPFEWWNKLIRMCEDKEDSSFWVFFDNSQKINNKRSVSLRGFQSQKTLNTIIRTTGEIHRFITGQKYMSVNSDVQLGHDFDGEKVDVLVPSTNFVVVDKSAHLMYILISQLYRLIIVDGHSEDCITVLFNDEKERKHNQQMFLRQTNNSCPVRSGQEVSKTGVMFDTIRRYSGEEKGIVIGFCPKYQVSNVQDNNALMVTLCSRAKLKLILILGDEGMAVCFKLAKWKNIKYGDLHAVNNFTM